MVSFCTDMAARIMILCLWCVARSANGADGDALVDKWLGAQTNIVSWHGAFQQTRSLKALKQPLVSTGQVWFAAPGSFRWQVGSTQTVAIRKEQSMLVLYPKLQRAERYDFEKMSGGQWKDALALLQAGFPRSRQELSDQYRLKSTSATNEAHRIVLEPRSFQARKMLPELSIFVAIGNYQLKATELKFADGSLMRNDFSNVQTNIPIESGIFSIDPPVGWTVTEPLAEGKKK